MMSGHSLTKNFTGMKYNGTSQSGYTIYMDEPPELDCGDEYFELYLEAEVDDVYQHPGNGGCESWKCFTFTLDKASPYDLVIEYKVQGGCNSAYTNRKGRIKKGQTSSDVYCNDSCSTTWETGGMSGCPTTYYGTVIKTYFDGVTDDKYMVVDALSF